MVLDNIKKEQQVINKTWMYMVVSILYYGNAYYDYLKSMFCVVATIGDAKFSKLTGKEYNEHIFLVFDTQTNREGFIKGLKYYRSHKSYEADYVVNHPTLQLHAIVLKIPDIHAMALTKLLDGKYSKMYSWSTLQKYFPENLRKKKPYKVLTQDDKYRLEFEQEIAKLGEGDNYDGSAGRSIIKLDHDAELDFKFKLEEEVLHYEEQTVMV